MRTGNVSLKEIGNHIVSNIQEYYHQKCHAFDC